MNRQIKKQLLKLDRKIIMAQGVSDAVDMAIMEKFLFCQTNDVEHVFQPFRVMRKRAGKTQVDIAGYLGVTSRTVIKWDNCQTLPSVAVLMAMESLVAREQAK